MREPECVDARVREVVGQTCLPATISRYHFADQTAPIVTTYRYHFPAYLSHERRSPYFFC